MKLFHPFKHNNCCVETTKKEIKVKIYLPLTFYTSHLISGFSLDASGIKGFPNFYQRYN
jgi:hypothetical protein